MTCAETSDRSVMSTPKTIFIVGWVIGNTCSMYALVCAFIQLLIYSETADDKEAMRMYKNHPASKFSYLFFLTALVMGCLLMVYPYLWVVGYWRAVIISACIVSGAGTIFLYDVTTQISLVVNLKKERTIKKRGVEEVRNP